MVPGAFCVRCQKSVCQLFQKRHGLFRSHIYWRRGGRRTAWQTGRQNMWWEKHEGLKDGEKKPSVRTRNKPVVTVNRGRWRDGWRRRDVQVQPPVSSYNGAERQNLLWSSRRSSADRSCELWRRWSQSQLGSRQHPLCFQIWSSVRNPYDAPTSWRTVSWSWVWRTFQNFLKTLFQRILGSSQLWRLLEFMLAPTSGGLTTGSVIVLIVKCESQQIF